MKTTASTCLIGDNETAEACLTGRIRDQRFRTEPDTGIPIRTDTVNLRKNCRYRKNCFPANPAFWYLRLTCNVESRRKASGTHPMKWEHKAKSDRIMSCVPGKGKRSYNDRKQCRFDVLLKRNCFAGFVRAGMPRTSVKFRADKMTYDSTLLEF